MIALALFALMHRESYSHKVYRELQGCAFRLDKYKHHPPQSSTDQEDSMYLTRGMAEVVIVQQKLVRYQQGKLSREDVESALKQLRRDVEDVPAVDDSRLKN